MLKELSQLAEGDWVVIDSLITSRYVTMPFQVAKISQSRVYLQRHRPDPVTHVMEVRDERFVARKSIRHVFTDEASANALGSFARSNSEEYEQKYRELQAEYRKKFDTFLAAVPRAPLPSGTDAQVLTAASTGASA